MTQINLLPWREQARQTKKIIFGLSIAAAFTVGVVVVIIIHIGLSSMYSFQKKRTNYLQAELDQLSGGLMMLNKKKKEELNVEGQLNYLMTLRRASFDAVQLLNELSMSVPKSIELSKISRLGRRITIEGQAQTNASITLLMSNLVKTNFFKQPDLTEISGKDKEVKDSKGHSFVLTVEIAKRAG